MTKLEKAYQSLPANKQALIRKSIMTSCGFSKATFYYKLKFGGVKKPEQKVFARHFAMTVEDLFNNVTPSIGMKKAILNDN